MKFTESEIPGLWLIDPVRHKDARGYFCETFRRDEFEAATGTKPDFVQENESMSVRGVLRGLHYQGGAHSQAKLVGVSEGRIIDVAVDLRRSSPTFLRHIAVELDSDSGRRVFIPRGFAHGFVVLSDVARFHYKVDNYYCPASEHTIRFDDPALGIKWPEIEGGYIFSEKDLRGKALIDSQLFD